MSNMQEFYARLFQTPETDSPDWASLVQLTQATVVELTALKALIDWVNWRPEVKVA